MLKWNEEGGERLWRSHLQGAVTLGQCKGPWHSRYDKKEAAPQGQNWKGTLKLSPNMGPLKVLVGMGKVPQSYSPCSGPLHLLHGESNVGIPLGGFRVDGYN